MGVNGGAAAGLSFGGRAHAAVPAPAVGGKLQVGVGAPTASAGLNVTAPSVGIGFAAKAPEIAPPAIGARIDAPDASIGLQVRTLS